MSELRETEDRKFLDESNAKVTKDFREEFGVSEFNLDPIFDGPLQEQDQKAQAFVSGLARLRREQEEVFAEDVLTGHSGVARAIVKLRSYERAIAQFNADPRAAELVRRVEAASVEKALKTVLDGIFKR